MKNKKLLFRSALFLLLVNAGVSHAAVSNLRLSAEPTSIETGVKDKYPQVTFLNEYGSFFEDVSVLQLNVQEVVQNLNTFFKVDQNHTFKKINTSTDDLGIEHIAFQHYYKNIAVDGELVMLHAKNGVLQTINGQFTPLSEVATSQSISNEQALEIAKKEFAANEFTKIVKVEPIIIKYEEPREGSVSAKFVTKVQLNSLTPLKFYTYYIDQNSGEILFKTNDLKAADTPSTSQTLYNGNQAITVDSYNGQFRLKDNARKIHTKNGSTITGYFSEQEGLLGATEYSNSAANFTSTATKPAVEVHWAMEKTYDYYKLIHNRLSYDGNGSPIRNYYTLNPNLPGLGPEQTGFPNNAFALPTYNVMVYGEGDNQIMKPVVGVDVAGHEYSHMVIEYNGHGGLNYQNESGALNESFADMLGTSIEFYSNASPNWRIGENIFLLPPYHMRDMANPKNAYYSLEQPDTYKGQYWLFPNDPAAIQDNGGVHTNSGVGNKWFYLLSMGGSGTNDVGNAYNVQAQTITKAEKIIYRALTQYMTANAQYIDARTATVQAAKDLYGAASNEVKSVENAWYAVNVGTNPSAGIDDTEFNTSIAVYPNPTHDAFVNIDNTLTATTKVALYDMTGKQVKSEVVINQGNNQLDISGIQPGVYVLKFTIEGKIHAQKLIIK